MVNINVMSQGEDSESSILTVHDCKQSKESREEERQQLLPGIPNEITIYQIAPKLPWTAFHMLSSVSRGWQQAIQSHQIYKGRVRSQGTETLVVLTHQHPFDEKSHISLFSSKDGSCWKLPSIPGFQAGFPPSFRCISLDGKFYIIGGDSRINSLDASAEVYVLDLAGQRQWKQLASMKYPRVGFGCGVMNDKIYVFGGTFDLKPVCGSEVYDPEENAWSPVAPMMSFRALHKVTAVGEELFAHGGQAFHPDFFEWTREIPFPFHPQSPQLIRTAFSAEIYHPLKDQWRIVEHFTETRKELVVTMQGKLQKVSWRGIDVYDIHENSWKPLHSFSFDELERSDSFLVWPVAVVPVDNELLSVVLWQNVNAQDHEQKHKTSLMRSEGCGGEKKVVWHNLQCSLPFGTVGLISAWDMCPIQL